MLLIHHIGDFCWLPTVSAVKRQYNMLTQVYQQCVLRWGSNERRCSRLGQPGLHFRGVISVQILRAMGSIALVGTLLVRWCAGVGVLTNTASADDCLAEPNSPAPAGSHWYYHLDRATQRKCWYIHAKDQPVQPAAAQATSDPASLPPAAPIPLEKPAPASANGPMSTSPGDSAPPLPRVKVPAVKPQRASVSGTATDQSALQGAQEATPQASPALSIQAPAPQASPSSQTGTQGAEPAPATATAWPDLPAVAVVKAQAPAPVSSESVRPTAGARASDDAQSTARDSGSTANAAGTAASVTARPWKLEIRM
jgi:hypothetical protein